MWAVFFHGGKPGHRCAVLPRELRAGPVCELKIIKQLLPVERLLGVAVDGKGRAGEDGKPGRLKRIPVFYFRFAPSFRGRDHAAKR